MVFDVENWRERGGLTGTVRPSQPSKQPRMVFSQACFPINTFYSHSIYVVVNLPL
jgi:hypothetical protein